MSLHEVVLVGGARTAQGKLNGQLAKFSAVELGSHAVKGALRRAGVAASDIDAVIMGQVVQAGSGQNPARQTALGAGIGWEVPATTINKVCLSGLAAIIDAARLIRLGDANVVVAGGQESMTNAPHLLPGSRQGWLYGDSKVVDSVARDGLSDAHENISMGVLTERGNAERDISRAAQDEVAATSHTRAAAAQSEGLFAAEIEPMTVTDRKGNSTVIDTDEGVRPQTTAESLGKLRPAFDREGTITAGNASPLSDGATAVVLASREYAERNNLTIIAVIGEPGQVAGPDSSLHSQPSRAIAAALKRAGWSASDLDFIEVNEAFGAVVCQSIADLNIPAEKCNIHGGAIAMGHPIGASGARVALHAALELQRRGSGKAAVSLCGGGGQGEALLLYRA